MLFDEVTSLPLSNMAEEDGKVNGKYPIFNDLLCFLACKIKLCPKDTLINVIAQYYKADDVMKARDVLFAAVPPAEGEPRRQRQRKVDEVLGTMYNLLQNVHGDDAPVFASWNLNNVPWVELKSVDGASLMWQQGAMKDQLTELKNEQVAMKEQLAVIMQFVQSSAQNGVVNQPAQSYRDALSGSRNGLAGNSTRSADASQQQLELGVQARGAEAADPHRPTGTIPKQTLHAPGDRRASHPPAAASPPTTG